MANTYSSNLMMLLLVIVLASMLGSLKAQDQSALSLDYYAASCPTAQAIVRKEMECAVRADPRNAAAILRLHFHDCFVEGCDGSVLLGDTYTIKGEKDASQNVNSLIGFDLVDQIKAQLESGCPGIVSCADLLAIAARDAVLLVLVKSWRALLGRPGGEKGFKKCELGSSEHRHSGSQSGPCVTHLRLFRKRTVSNGLGSPSWWAYYWYGSLCQLS